MVFAAQELLRDNLSTPQNVKFAGAFPTLGSARAPLGRARRGAATVGVARKTRFFIPLGGDSQSPRRISNRTRFATWIKKTQVDGNNQTRIRDRVPDERSTTKVFIFLFNSSSN